MSTSDIIDDDNSYDDDKYDLYCPDFSVTRRPTSHTTVRTKSFEEQEIIMLIDRPYVTQMVPITEIDDIIGTGSIKSGKHEITLGSHNSFKDVIDALEEVSTHIVTSYDKNRIRDLRIYKVPVTGFINEAKTYKKITKNVNSFQINEEERERYIVIGDSIYSTSKTYKRNGTNFFPIKIQNSISITRSDSEQIFKIAKISTRSDSITMSFHRPTSIHTIFIEPEKMQFEYVHSDIIHCGHNNKCTKRKHCISVLKNDPQFIKRFDLFYRSVDTNKKWFKIGTFNCASSMIDSVHVEFDEIIADEIRIVPITFHNGFNKVEIACIGDRVNQTPVTDDLFVTYSIYMPRDGKYIKSYDKMKQVNSSRYCIGCDCAICKGGKVSYKEKCRFLSEACSDMYV